MNNLMVGVKKFLSNKNTVTIIGAIAAIVVLYVGYNWRVQQATNPITVPYALQDINPSTQITEDMVGEAQVPPTMIKGDIIRSKQSVIDKYSNADTVIPQGSLFYTRAVVEKDQLPDGIILDYPKGYVLYYMTVNMTTTYSNSIYPNNYIDIYFKATYASGDENDPNNGKVMVGKLVENVKVLAVRDSNGKNVFSNVNEDSVPAMLIFAVPEEHYILLKKAEYLRNYSTELTPVPTAESQKTNPGDLKLSSSDIKDFINSVTVWTDGTE